MKSRLTSEDIRDLSPRQTINGNNIGYVLPHRIDKNQKGHVKLFFRVTNTFRNCVINVVSGGEVIASKKRNIAVPGEMETLILTQDKIALLNDDITVELKEGV